MRRLSSAATCAPTHRCHTLPAVRVQARGEHQEVRREFTSGMLDASGEGVLSTESCSCTRRACGASIVRVHAVWGVAQWGGGPGVARCAVSRVRSACGPRVRRSKYETKQ